MDRARLGRDTRHRALRRLAWTIPVLLACGCDPPQYAAVAAMRSEMGAHPTVEVVAVEMTGKGPTLGDITRSLGHVAVTGAERDAILLALDEAVDRADTGMLSRCFRPHHVLLVERDGERWMVEICFGCQQVALRRAGDHRTRVNIGPSDLRERLDGAIRRVGLTFDPTGRGAWRPVER